MKGRVSTVTKLQEAMEQVILGLRNVISTRVVLAGEQIEEIHVLADPGRPAKRIVRDIETALLASFGLAIDHRIISVAQLSKEPDLPVGDHRLVLAALRVELLPAASSVNVELMWDGQLLKGTCEAARGLEDKGRLAACATLQAVESLFPKGRIAFGLDGSTIMQLGKERICLVAVRVALQGRQERLLGTSLLDSDLPEAAAKATLDAINRRLGYLVRVLPQLF